MCGVIEDVRGACEPLELLAGRLTLEHVENGAAEQALLERRRRASSSTMPPRAVLTRIADGFSRPRRSSSSRPRVSSVSATLTVTRSARRNSSSRSARSTPGSSRSLRDQPSTRMPKATPELGDAHADAPEPDDAECLAGQLEAPKAAVLPAPAPRRLLRLKEPPLQGDHGAERELGDRLRRRCGHDGDRDPPRRGRLHVDVRVTGRAGGDESQARQTLEHGGIDLRIGVERDEHLGAVRARSDLVGRRGPEGHARRRFPPQALEQRLVLRRAVDNGDDLGDSSRFHGRREHSGIGLTLGLSRAGACAGRSSRARPRPGRRALRSARACFRRAADRARRRRRPPPRVAGP